MYNYLYCASLNITIYNRTITCPNETFVLPANQSFNIGDIEYKTQSMNLHTELHFIPSWSYAINHMLDPKMRENVFEGYLKQIDNQLDGLNENMFDFDANSPTTKHKYFNIILFACLIITCMSFIIYAYRQKLFQSKNIANNSVKMSELHEIQCEQLITSDDNKPTVRSRTEPKVLIQLNK